MVCLNKKLIVRFSRFFLVEYHAVEYFRFVVFVFMVVISIIFEVGLVRMRNVHLVVVIDVKIVTLKIVVHVEYPNVLLQNHRLSFNSDSKG
jgi:hypothetical protein